MFARKKSKREQWAMQSLIQRLAAIDEGGPLLLTHRQPGRQDETGRIGPVAFFIAGFVCAAVVGVVALAIISIVNEDARQERAPYALATTVNDPSVEPPNEGRLLWWKISPQRQSDERVLLQPPR
jgi:hypothetical protein